MSETDPHNRRYLRHIQLPQIGEDGQQKIQDAKVLVIGAGGLGSSALLYLAAAGIGQIGVADGDVVDVTNLARQVIHSTPDIDKPKVTSALEKINRLNPNINVTTYGQALDRQSMPEIINTYDFIIDATDNFKSKFLINDVSVMAGKPFCHAGVTETTGQVMTVIPYQSACYRCVFKDIPPTDAVPPADQSGIFGPVPGIAGLLQASEAVKFIVKSGKLLTDAILTFDVFDMSFRKIKVKRSNDCQACRGEHVS